MEDDRVLASVGHDIQELYAWVHQDDVGNEFVLTSVIPVAPHIGAVPLVTTSRGLATGLFANAAGFHTAHTGRRVRLLRWTAYEDITKEAKGK